MNPEPEFGPVLELLEQVPRPPEAPPCSGASEEQVRDLERFLGHPVPPVLEAWLRVCNGDEAGPGGLYGTGTGDEYLDIESVLGLHPDWQPLGWVPIAGDGTGNQYVIDTRRRHLEADAVYFVDVYDDPPELRYVAASSVDRFLLFLLRKELGEQGWPFRAEHVLATDPDLAAVDPPTLLPWNA